MKRFSKNSGFTMIELMIILAIVGILCAIIIPGVGDWHYKKQAKGGLHAIRKAALSYYDTNLCFPHTYDEIKGHLNKELVEKDILEINEGKSDFIFIVKDKMLGNLALKDDKMFSELILEASRRVSEKSKHTFIAYAIGKDYGKQKVEIWILYILLPPDITVISGMERKPITEIVRHRVPLESLSGQGKDS